MPNEFVSLLVHLPAPLHVRLKVAAALRRQTLGNTVIELLSEAVADAESPVDE